MEIFLISKIVFPTIGGLWGYMVSKLTLIQFFQASTTDPLTDLVSLGMGGALAAAVLWWAIVREKEHTAERKEMRDKHEATIKELLDKHEREMRELRDRTDKREDNLLKTVEQVNETIRTLKGLVESISKGQNVENQLNELVKTFKFPNRGE